MRPLASRMQLGPWLRPDPAVPSSPRHHAGAGSPQGQGTRQPRICNGTEGSFPGHPGCPGTRGGDGGSGRAGCRAPDHRCGGSGGPARKRGHLDPILGAGTNSASASSLLPGRGKPGRGGDRLRAGGAQAPLTAPQPAAPKGSHERPCCFPPTLHPSLTCLLRSSRLPWGELHPRFTAQAQGCKPSPTYRCPGKVHE